MSMTYLICYAGPNDGKVYETDLPPLVIRCHEHGGIYEMTSQGQIGEMSVAKYLWRKDGYSEEYLRAHEDS